MNDDLVGAETPRLIAHSLVPRGQAPMPTPKRVRTRLTTPGECSAFLATLARESRAGQLDLGDLTRWTYVLSSLAKMLEGQQMADMEARLATLEGKT